MIEIQINLALIFVLYLGSLHCHVSKTKQAAAVCQVEVERGNSAAYPVRSLAEADEMNGC